MQNKKSSRTKRNKQTSIFGWLYLILLLVCSVLFSCANNPNNKPVIFVASSLNQVFTEVSRCEKMPEIVLNTASSGILARQIEAGADCDIYVSANKKWIDFLLEKQLVDSAHVRVIAQNYLVAIIPASDSLKVNVNTPWFSYAQNCERLAMGDPAHVPSGDYAKQALLKIGIFEQLAPKIIATKDVVSALRLVELKEANLGFVYKTDALNSNKVKVFSILNDTLYTTINYYMATLTCKGDEIVKNSDFTAALNKFLHKNGFE